MTAIDLLDAIDNLAEGFAMFDADDRLVACNARYRDLLPLVADLIVTGIPFRELMRAALANGQFADAGDAEAWLARRMADRRAGAPPFQQRLADGRVVMVSERPTAAGGVVGTWTEITGLLALQQEVTRLQESAGQIAHDFNNILAAVMANVEFADELTDAADPRKVLLGRAWDGVQRGAHLTEILLALAQDH